MQLAPGLRVSRFVLTELLGEGGMGQVWAADADLGLGATRRVALKFVRANGVDEALFRDEVSVLAALHHPNLVQLLEAGEATPWLWYAMEWVPGVTLAALVASRRGVVLPAPVALTIIADVCEGLHAAHVARDERGALLGIVHRDVAPSNVLVTPGGLSKVIDFGIATSSTRTAQRTNPGVVRGRVAYLAPERVLGLDARHPADQWAVGVLSFELLTGKALFKRKTMQESLRAVLDFSGLPLVGLAPPLERCLSRMLAVDPDARLPATLVEKTDEVPIRPATPVVKRPVAFLAVAALAPVVLGLALAFSRGAAPRPASSGVDIVTFPQAGPGGAEAVGAATGARAPVDATGTGEVPSGEGEGRARIPGGPGEPSLQGLPSARASAPASPTPASTHALSAPASDAAPSAAAAALRKGSPAARKPAKRGGLDELQPVGE